MSILLKKVYLRRVLFSCKDAALQVLMSVCVCVSQGEILPSYSIQGNSRIIKDAQGCSRMFQNVPECMQIHVQNVPECSRMHAVCRSMSRMFKNVLECFRMFKNADPCPESRMFKNIPECMQIHGQNVPKCMKIADP